jgi:hypothetical protein
VEEVRQIRELEAILEVCQRRGIAVFVIGGFGVRVYGGVLRRALELDLAVERADWPVLAEILEARGYHLKPLGVCVRARKGEGEEAVEITVALGKVTDAPSALSYPVGVEPGTQQPLPDLNVTLPVFTPEGLLITRLIALRDSDVVDIVALLAQQADQVAAERFWERAAAAGLESALADRLAELEEMLKGDAVAAIWWDRLGLTLDESERQAALEVVGRLRAYR